MVFEEDDLRKLKILKRCFIVLFPDQVVVQEFLRHCLWSLTQQAAFWSVG